MTDKNTGWRSRFVGWLQRFAPESPAPAPAPSRRGFDAVRRPVLRAVAARSLGKGPNAAIFSDLRALQAIAREQAMNNSYAKRFYQVLRQNVVGPRGFSFQSKAQLPGSEKLDKAANAAIESEWKKFCARGVFDVTDRYSLTTFLWTWLTSLARDGEVLVREISGYKGNRYRYALQLVDIDRLDVGLNGTTKTGRKIVMGIELGEYEKPVAYYLRAGDADATGLHYANGRSYERVPAAEIIHTFDPFRAEQIRGVPWLHAAMIELHHVGAYREAEMMAAELGAKVAGWYEQDPDAVDEDPEEDIELEPEIEAGQFQVLPYGIKVKQAAVTHPSSNFAAFIKAAIRGVASGSGVVAYNRLANDLENVNFSSLRAGELDERDAFKSLQQFVIESLLTRIHRNWLRHALLTAAVPLPLSDLDRFSAPFFQGRGWSWVNPKDAEIANKQAIANRTKSRTEIILEDGRDPDEVWANFDREEKYLRSRGLLPPVAADQLGNAADGDDEADAGTAGADA